MPSRQFITFCVGVLFVLISMPITAKPDSIGVNSISVSGHIELYKPADQAEFSFEVVGKGSSLRESVEKARQEVGRISGQLYSLGVDKKNVSISHFYSGDNEGNKAFLSAKRDFKAAIRINVKIDSLELVESAIIAVSENKPEQISDISFLLIDIETARLEALEKAAKKAKVKANLLAQTFNIQLGSVLKVVEKTKDNAPQLRIRGGRANPFNAVFLDQEAISGDGIFTQQISISAAVYLVQEIRN